MDLSKCLEATSDNLLQGLLWQRASCVQAYPWAGVCVRLISVLGLPCDNSRRFRRPSLHMQCLILTCDASRPCQDTIVTPAESNFTFS